MYPYPILGHFYLYGIMIAVGIVGTFTTILLYCRSRHIEPKFTDFVFYTGIGAILFGFFSASFFQSFYEYLEHPEKGFSFSGNITFIGGLVGGTAFFLAVYFLLRRRFHNKLLDVLPVIPASIVIAHAFGRVGCFCAGCCYGKPTDGPLGVKFPLLPEPVYPTQLYEAIFLFLLFGVLLYLALRYDSLYTFPVYLLSYGVFRFLIEFLRGDDRGGVEGLLSPSQFWSIGMVLLGIFLIFAFRYHQKKVSLAKEKPDE